MSSRSPLSVSVMLLTLCASASVGIYMNGDAGSTIIFLDGTVPLVQR